MELVREQVGNDPERLAKVLAGLRAYQEAPRDEPQPEMPVIAEIMGASLRDYGGEGAPVLFIPSLINPPNVLDLGPERSLLRWLAACGHHVLLLDWGWDIRSRRGLDVAGHVERIILPFIHQLPEVPALVGYCLGGTMAVAAAAHAKVRALATIAAPWHFSGYPPDARDMLKELWIRSEPAVASLGVLPMELLQSAFWSLDPGRTVSKFERFAEMDHASVAASAFVALEDWSNDGPPLPQAAAREMFERFLDSDVPGSGRWKVVGRTIDPAALPCPMLNIVSTTDRIVPQESAISAGEGIALPQGHVGMVVGSRARESLWQPLEAWLSRTRAN